MDTNRFIVRNRKAGIEGMPLMIIIMVVIAVAVLGIVLGWIFLASDSDPMIKKITVEPETVKVASPAPTIKIYVWDTDGDKVEGATITITGLNVNTAPVKTAKVGTDVYASITLTGLSLAPGAQTGTLSVLAEKTGMGKKTLDVVVSV